MTMTLEERKATAKARRDRVLKYITQDPPVPFYNLMMLEGMTERPLREIIAELEQEHNFKYLGTTGARNDGAMPPGVTDATARLRSNLANHLYRLRTDKEFGVKGREAVAPLTGINPREQIRAESSPFRHNWTLSQIERLARALGEDPREFLLKRLTRKFIRFGNGMR